MNARTRLLTAALTAVVALAIAASSAMASRSLEIRNAERGVTTSGRAIIADSEEVGREITCDVTLLKTIARTVAKRAGNVFGKVTGVAIDRGTLAAPHCRGTGVRSIVITPLTPSRAAGRHRELGSGVLLFDVSGALELWNLVYDSFQGTLPLIRGINFHIDGAVLELAYETIIGPFSCLYRGRVLGLIAIERENITSLSPEGNELELFTGIACPRTWTFLGVRWAVAPSLAVRLL